MVKFCMNCGAANPASSLFCAKCGTSLFEPEAPASGSDTLPEGSAFISSPRSARRPWLARIIILATLVTVGVLYYWLFLADDMREAPDTSEVAIQSGTPVEAKTYFAMIDANIRDKPTTVDSRILGKIPRGSRLTGVARLSADGKSDWLKLSDGKGFVAMVNLAENEPPEITRMLDDKIWTTDAPLDIWATTDSASSLLDRVNEGTRLTLSGLTANDFIEVKLPKGGVGYLADGAAILARLGGKPVNIAFNPQTCSFGGELGTEFAKIGSRLKTQWEQLENREFANDEAREKAYAAIEGRSTYAKLGRSFEGLSLTAIGQHNESQSIYFSDSPSKVIEVFRKKGYRIDGNGNFPSTDLYAGISATRGEGAAYGRSELGCGV
jgi:uncharacterized protein YgiM (DUF1202 family)